VTFVVACGAGRSCTARNEISGRPRTGGLGRRRPRYSLLGPGQIRRPVDRDQPLPLEATQRPEVRRDDPHPHAPPGRAHQDPDRQREVDIRTSEFAAAFAQLGCSLARPLRALRRVA
jgi:hypothetical protein